jgi:hypothetical protein
MNTAIVQRQQLTPDIVQMIQTIAPIMKASRLFGVASDEQAMAVMIKGYELGFNLSSSFEFVVPVQGKPTLVPKGMMALIMNSDVYESHSVTETVDDKGNPYSCTVRMKRTNGFEFTVTYTMDDARRAGLVKKDGAWESYPANMLRYRALGFCADQVFPDVIGGMKRADELGAAVNADGEIEGTWTVEMSTPATVEPEPITLQSLVDEYGADAVMEAAGGSIPGTPEEIAACAEMLIETEGKD